MVESLDSILEKINPHGTMWLTLSVMSAVYCTDLEIYWLIDWWKVKIGKGRLKNYTILLGGGRGVIKKITVDHNHKKGGDSVQKIGQIEGNNYSQKLSVGGGPRVSIV